MLGLTLVSADSEFLLTADIRELQDQLNLNTCDECDSWLDAEEFPDHVTVILEDELFARYFLED